MLHIKIVRSFLTVILTCVIILNSFVSPAFANCDPGIELSNTKVIQSVGETGIAVGAAIGTATGLTVAATSGAGIASGLAAAASGSAQPPRTPGPRLHRWPTTSRQFERRSASSRTPRSASTGPGWRGS